MNIEIHGLPNDEKIVFQLAEAIWRQIIVTPPGKNTDDCAVTHVPSQSFDHTGKRVPFLRVYSDKQSDFEQARKLLRPIRLPGTKKKIIECVLLTKCWSE